MASFKRILAHGLMYGLCLSLSAVPQARENGLEKIVEGDILGHTSQSSQSTFIKIATWSPYTHVGIAVEKDDGMYVLEAVEPVRYTPLDEWVDRGKDDNYTVMRLKDEYRNHIPSIIEEAETHLGKHYDAHFDPGDDEIYCSELITKAAEEGAGIQIGEWESFDDIVGLLRYFPPAKRMIENRWGDVPSDMEVVTPESVMESDMLEPVFSNY